MQIEIDIDTKCKECGNRLDNDVDFKRNTYEITVEACDNCISAAQDKKLEQEYDRIVKEGFDDGYRDAEKEIQITLDDAKTAVKKYLKAQNLTNVLTDIQVEEIAKSMGYP